MKEMVGGCCVCSDESGSPENPLVYCDGDGCNVAVHQACYGILQVPAGAWFCKRCESQERAARVRCELCPSKDGAFKKTDTGLWAHVVCALYIPEVRFGNVSSMEPIMVSSLPSDRFHKTCYVCEEQGKESKASFGACMQCNKSGCKQYFHVTCAQVAGLLCEEAGVQNECVKYCGYCRRHYNKLLSSSEKYYPKDSKRFTLIASNKDYPNIKPIPAFKPIPADYYSGHVSSDSSPGKKSPAVHKSSSDNNNDKHHHGSGSNRDRDNHGSGSSSASSSSTLHHHSSSSSRTLGTGGKGIKDEAGAKTGGKGSREKDKDDEDIFSTSISDAGKPPKKKKYSLVSKGSKDRDKTSSTIDDVIGSLASPLSKDPLESSSSTSSLSLTRPSDQPIGASAFSLSTYITPNLANKNKDTFSGSSSTGASNSNQVKSSASSEILNGSKSSSDHHAKNERSSDKSSSLLTSDDLKSSKKSSGPSLTESLPPVKEKYKHDVIFSTSRDSLFSSSSKSVPAASSSSGSSKISSKDNKKSSSKSTSEVHSSGSKNIKDVDKDTRHGSIAKSKGGRTRGSPARSSQMSPASNSKGSSPSTPLSSSILPSLKATKKEILKRRISDTSTETEPDDDETHTHRYPPVRKSSAASKSSSSKDEPESKRKKRQTRKEPKIPVKDKRSSSSKDVDLSPVNGSPKTSSTSVSSKNGKNENLVKGARNSKLIAKEKLLKGSSGGAAGSTSAGDSEHESTTRSRTLKSSSGPSGLNSSPDDKSPSKVLLMPPLKELYNKKGPSASSSLDTPFGNRNNSSVHNNNSSGLRTKPNGFKPSPSPSLTPMINRNASSGHSVDMDRHHSSSSDDQTPCIPSAPTALRTHRHLPIKEPTEPPPSSLESLLERQWTQGAQFIMDQAHGYDIASLLSCLSQLKEHNERLEERLRNLTSRREHLLTVNSRLALPLNGSFMNHQFHSGMPGLPSSTGSPFNPHSALAAASASQAMSTFLAPHPVNHLMNAAAVVAAGGASSNPFEARHRNSGSGSDGPSTPTLTMNGQRYPPNVPQGLQESSAANLSAIYANSFGSVTGNISGVMLNNVMSRASPSPRSTGSGSPFTASVGGSNSGSSNSFTGINHLTNNTSHQSSSKHHK